MKIRFNTLDIIAILNELQEKVDMRVNQVYDVDHKTYLIKLGRHEEKATLLLESGTRFHTTNFDWPKNSAPSGFTMKLRKHLKNKRLEKISQLGVDRIIDLQFGSNEVACHVILELYDRGNIVLTDYTYTILNILRPRATGHEDVKLIVREVYPTSTAKQDAGPIGEEKIKTILSTAKTGEQLKRIFISHVNYGAPLLEHVFHKHGFKNCQIGPNFDVDAQLTNLLACFTEAEKIFKEISDGKKFPGFIVQKIEKSYDNEQEKAIFEDFSPIKFSQFDGKPVLEFESYDKSVDTYFSNVESQKTDLKRFHKEKDAYKKLDNIKKDHFQRIGQLQKVQDDDCYKAQLIEMNLELVDTAILVISNAIANQTSWEDIEELLQEARGQGDSVAKSIKHLKLGVNHFVIGLTDPYDNTSEGDPKPILIEIDLDHSAYANARLYYDKKKTAAKKEQKTVESSTKAYKSAEKKAMQALKEIAVTARITQTRKHFWFEKFQWFISSENYMVVAGRDVQQNELLVKRYLKPGDLYVHADLHGASSVILKNPSGKPVPPKTLNEAGTMAVCYSGAWDAKIVTSAWWVHHNQVSKTAPTGEYLTQGSFMIRGKKNYLPPCHLIMGFGFLFKLDEDSFERHKGERKVRLDDEDDESVHDVKSGQEASNETEIDLSENSDNDEEPVEIKVEENKDEAVNDVVEDESDEEESCFPDTVVSLLPTTKTETSLALEPNSSERSVIFHPNKKNSSKSQNKQPNKNNAANKAAVEDEPQNANKAGPKRGQKSKLKKIKEKYRFQDEEERQLRLQILGSAGTENVKKNKKGKDNKVQPAKGNKQQQKSKVGQAGIITQAIEILHMEDAAPEVLVGDEVKNEDSDPEEAEEGVKVTEDTKLLDSLTGSPHSEDTLHFALPVCAPYSAMQNYKFKVKAMPGTGKRGKAGKTALNMFINDKTTLNREKDLLKSVKDQDISRNLPGKVKLAAPNLNKKK